MKKVLPAKKVVSDKDRAQERREKLERMQKIQSGLDDDHVVVDKKRDAKFQSKAQQAMEAAILAGEAK